MENPFYFFAFAISTILITSCSSENDLINSENDSAKTEVLSRETDSIAELNESDFPKVENIETRSLIDSELRNELTQLNGMYFSIQSNNYGYGNNTLEYVGKGKELKLAPYSSTNNKQKFYFEFPSSASGVLSRIYSAQDKVPIGIGTYSSKPNEYVLYAKSSNTGNFFGFAWDFHYNTSKDAYIIENTDVFSPGNSWATSFFAITSQNGKLSMTKIDKGLSQQFTIIPDDDFEIRGIELLHNQGKIIEAKPEIIKERRVDNKDYNTSLKHNASFSETLTNSTSFQEQNTITTSTTGSLDVKLSLSTVVSIGGSNTITSGAQQTLTYSTNSTQTTVLTENYEITVQPRTIMTYQYISTKYKLDVPYIATLEGRKTKKKIKIRGIWSGVDYSLVSLNYDVYYYDNPTVKKNSNTIYFK